MMMMSFHIYCLILWLSGTSDTIKLFRKFNFPPFFALDVVFASSTATAATTTSATPSTNLNMYWQSELTATSTAQNKILSFLKQHDVPIGFVSIQYYT